VRSSVITRRDFGTRIAATVAAAAVPVGCSSGHDEYQALVASTWRLPESAPAGHPAALRELVRYATLAANSHNTQPWRFRIESTRITVSPDFGRRCPAVDPDDHHLYASLGCATENLVVAARALGWHPNVSIEPSPDVSIRIDLEPTAPFDSPLFPAIPRRQCTRATYDGKRVPTEQLRALEEASGDDGVSVRVFTDRLELERILEYVVGGNTAQMNDDAFVEELKQWIRFSESSAVRYRDGLFTAASGNPSAPDWVGRLIFDFAFTTGSENDKYRDHLRSSAGAVAFVAERNDKESWIRVGRCCQRFALLATAFGLRYAFINQAVEVPEVRAQFADYLGVGDRRPDLLIRFGYGPELPRSLRRPLGDVLA
jgi:nitroreductase